MKAVLEFNRVSKVYSSGVFRRRRSKALDDFSLTVNRGEIFGFLGPNGAGKTTSIHIALGLAFPTAGSGRLIGSAFGEARTRRRVGFLAENVSFYNLPAGEMVRFYGRINGLRDPQLTQKVKELLQLLDLTIAAESPINKFSRGMLQRIGLAQALVNDPELLILDEPTSALDPAARVAVRELLLTAKSAGKTVFLSSHLLSEVELVCDRIGIMHLGRLVKLGTTSELLESRREYEVVARGIAPGELGSVVHQDSLVRLTVAATDQRAAIEKIWSQGGEIVSVMPARRTLEEVFLSLTGERSA